MKQCGIKQVKNPNNPPFIKAIYTPMNYTAPNGNAYRLDAISQGPKKFRFPGTKPLPIALVMDAARIKSITHWAI